MTTEVDAEATTSAVLPLTWTALLASYRSGARQEWSGVLIERLWPWLTAARRQLRAVPPYLDGEDVAQQLVLEVLQIASRWQPQCEDRWIPRRLVERAGRKVLRCLLAEQLNQTVELDDRVTAPQPEADELVIDTPIGKASVADLRLIYRACVRGEPADALAAEVGLTSEQMRRRLKSARARARAQRVKL